MPTVSLYPTGNTFVSTRKKRKNYSQSDHLFAGVRHSCIYRCLLRFNLSLIPSDATISSATLKLYLYDNPFQGSVKTFNIHRIMADYQESFVTWKNQPACDPVTITSFTVINESGVFKSIDLSELARQWHLGAYENYGILIKADIEYQNNRIGLRSLIYPNQNLRPVLDVTYQPPAPASSVQVTGFTFTRSSQTLTTGDNYTYTSAQEVGPLQLYNYFIRNTGSNPATFVLQVSPDNDPSGLTWLDDTPEKQVAPSGNAVITNLNLAQYVRLGYKSTNPGNPTTLTVWFQSRA